MLEFHIPMPLQIVIDDVGWWSGFDGHRQNQPFRTGIQRNHHPADYSALIELGRRLHMRPQAAMVLCEWDRTNLLRRAPTTTWMGARWDNSARVGPELDQAAEILRQGRKHLEITLHGVGHEYWESPDRPFSRAEWHDRTGRMRAPSQVRKHLECFAAILEQNGLGPFPESFVPAAFLHSFADGDRGLAVLLEGAGIRYISTPFAAMHRRNPPQYPHFGVDHGIMTVDRGNSRIPWDRIDSAPLGPIAGPILGLHWPNLLHPDPHRNLETIERWRRFIAPYGERIDRILAPDTPACFTQLAFRTLTVHRFRDHGVELDFRNLEHAGIRGLRSTFIVKLRTPQPLDFRGKNLEILSAQWSKDRRNATLELRRPQGVERAFLQALPEKPALPSRHRASNPRGFRDGELSRPALG